MNKTYEFINDILKKDFFWIPPYNSVNGTYINELINAIKTNPESAKYNVTKEIILPWRRAYQMVYRYKELSIFTPNILSVIECSTVSLLQGNHVCSYISLGA